MPEVHQIVWDSQLQQDCLAIVRLALAEDLNGEEDWTTNALVGANQQGTANIVARESGVAAGLVTIPLVIAEAEAALEADFFVDDGQQFTAGTTLAKLSGNVRDLLTLERTILNLLGRLMGIATLTSRYVQEVSGTSARIYDTRKTTPGWRRLEKYAVHCGGGFNHRMGLFDAILIKDNHLAQRSGNAIASPETAGEAVLDARRFLESPSNKAQSDLIIEIEVDNLEQLATVLPTQPDIILLDNMDPSQLREAVKLRDEHAPAVELEASGGIRLESLREVAETGVDRISAGALTHSARALDIGLDWRI
ncbi:carboxylating nicotinate-nucleotide diphosphorylase [Bythopirellula polymerisocia]|uniref:Probable nicotinate-nucleotide pyrophosphorylase [carboxylating] n=1 Tax=Bythopirellula polymerisocia TaxID=2528003 RepID=A0A5C6C9I7_9BACT|nr:carboxylating nicotinate-nucleotide diphosphorylase [Bythopirellula polymerisocia]TWU20828.1 Nicotinate-nucleotide pyrophosphorylase [carboxylating] [Bythopirellula polymerisocia]